MHRDVLALNDGWADLPVPSRVRLRSRPESLKCRSISQTLLDGGAGSSGVGPWVDPRVDRATLLRRQHDAADDPAVAQVVERSLRGIKRTLDDRHGRHLSG